MKYHIIYHILATCSAFVTDAFLYIIQIITCKLISGLFKGSYSCKEYDFILRRPFRKVLTNIC